MGDGRVVIAALLSRAQGMSSCQLQFASGLAGRLHFYFIYEVNQQSYTICNGNEQRTFQMAMQQGIFVNLFQQRYASRSFRNLVIFKPVLDSLPQIFVQGIFAYLLVVPLLSSHILVPKTSRHQQRVGQVVPLSPFIHFYVLSLGDYAKQEEEYAVRAKAAKQPAAKPKTITPKNLLCSYSLAKASLRVNLIWSFIMLYLYLSFYSQVDAIELGPKGLYYEFQDMQTLNFFLILREVASYDYSTQKLCLAYYGFMDYRQQVQPSTITSSNITLFHGLQIIGTTINHQPSHLKYYLHQIMRK